MPCRIRAYAALAEERYHLPVYPVLILFLPPPQGILIPTQFNTQFMGLHARQDYHVIKLWEVDSQLAFQPELSALLPFVPIMDGGSDRAIVQAAVRRLREQPNLTDLEPLLAFFASFVLESSLIQQIMRWDMTVLRESPWYNEILSQGRKEEAIVLLIRQTTRRIGTLPDHLLQGIQSLSLEQLEDLGEALLDFTTLSDLQTWFIDHN